mgnify:CR=1 FL=1
MKNTVLHYVGLYLLIIIGLVTAQWLMDVPSSDGDIGVFVEHTLGIWLAFFTGAVWVKNK